MHTTFTYLHTKLYIYFDESSLHGFDVKYDDEYGDFYLIYCKALVVCFPFLSTFYSQLKSHRSIRFGVDGKIMRKVGKKIIYYYIF